MLRGEIGSGRRHRETSGGAPRKLGRGHVAMRQGCLWVWVAAVPLQDLPRGRGWALASPPPRCPVRPRCVWQTRCLGCGPVPSARGRQADAPGPAAGTHQQRAIRDAPSLPRPWGSCFCAPAGPLGPRACPLLWASRAQGVGAQGPTEVGKGRGGPPRGGVAGPRPRRRAQQTELWAE